MLSNRFLAIGILLLLHVLLFTGYFYLQPVIDYAALPQFDGHQYLRLYQNLLQEGTPYEVSSPFHRRVFIPWLATLLPVQDPILSFQILNLIFGLLTIITLYFLWQHLEVPFFWMLAGFAWLWFHWLGPIRQSQLDPVTLDVATYFFQALLLLILVKKRYGYLLLVTPVAVLAKESFLALLIASLFFVVYCRLKMADEHSSLFFSLSVAVIMGIITQIIANQLFPPIEPGPGNLIVLAFYLKESILHPLRIVRWLTGIFVAFGPPFILGLLKFHHLPNSYFHRLLIVLAIVSCLLGLLGGEDLSRLVYLGFPFVMTSLLLILKEIKEIRIAWLALLMALPVLRLFSAIPLPQEDWQAYASWLPRFSTFPTLLTWLGYAFLCAVLLYVADRYILRSHR